MKSLPLLLVALAAASPAVAETRDAMAECQKMSAAYMDAYNKGDAAAVAKMYAANAVFSNSFWTATGREGIAHGYAAELAGGTKFSRIGCDHAAFAGPMGTAEGAWEAKAMGPDGKPMTVGGHYVVVVNKEKGGYVFTSHVANMQLPPPGAPTH